jgi:hypothetical protein
VAHDFMMLVMDHPICLDGTLPMTSLAVSPMPKKWVGRPVVVTGKFDTSGEGEWLNVQHVWARTDCDAPSVHCE